MVDIIPLGLDFFVQKLEEKSPFSFTRWGDGEWACVLGEEGQNCDGHTYFPELRKDLIKVLFECRGYFHSLLTVARRNKPELEDFIAKNNVRVPWYYGDDLLNASCNGKLFPFIQAIRTKRIIYVGPSRLEKLDGTVFDIETFVDVPIKNCYLKKREIELELMQAIGLLRDRGDEDIVILFSAGMLTKVIVDVFFSIYANMITMIDCGSMFDIYVGEVTRSYAKNGDWKTLIRKNLGE
jgi:hypothetical protein